MIIDVNVSLGVWPFREFLINSPGELDRNLKELDVSQAWVRSCRAAFLTDPKADNEKLQSQLKAYPDMIAIPTVNPVLSQWEQSVVDASIINIYPSYHRYRVDSMEVCELAKEIIKRQGILLITMRMEDSREMHPDCVIPDVPTDEIISLADKYPDMKIVCLNASIFEIVELCNQSSNIYCDIAYAESGDTIKKLIESIDHSKIVFGSHAPFFYAGAELMKIKCSAMSNEIKKGILCSNISPLN